MYRFSIKRSDVVSAPAKDYIPAKHMITRESVDGRMELVNAELAEKKEEKLEKDYQELVRRQDIADKQAGTIAKERRLVDIREYGPKYLFEQAIFRIYKNALVLDEAFVEEKVDLLKVYVHDQIGKDPDVTSVMDKALSFMPQGDTRIITDIMNVCKATSESVVNRLVAIAKEAGTDASALTFEPNEDEKKEFNDKLEDLSIDEISDLVKNKVISVIADEKKAAEDQDEKIKAAEDELVENDDINSEEDVQEALNFMYSQQDVYKEYSLFGAFMHRAYKNLLMESETEVPVEDNQDEFEEPVEVEFKDVDIDTNPEENSSTAEKAMAEAICEYTLLEVFNTLKLKSYSRNQVKDMAHEIAYM